ncbi:MAG: PTS sugar transporter subunit IIA [Polyangiaceae bacterium]
MLVTELLSEARVAIRKPSEPPLDKRAALGLLASLLAQGTGAPPERIEQALLEREALQSTGIGEGVAIPHEKLPDIENQCAALIVVPRGLAFDAIDGQDVNLIFGVVGPRKALVEHLKVLAKVSKLLRQRSLRERLLASETPHAAFELLSTEERKP